MTEFIRPYVVDYPLSYAILYVIMMANAAKIITDLLYIVVSYTKG